MNEMPLQPHQKAVAEKTVKKCIEELKTPSEETNGCSHIVLRANACVEAELFKSCPVDKQENTDECVQLRQTVNRSKNS